MSEPTNDLAYYISEYVMATVSWMHLPTFGPDDDIKARVDAICDRHAKAYANLTEECNKLRGDAVEPKG